MSKHARNNRAFSLALDYCREHNLDWEKHVVPIRYRGYIECYRIIKDGLILKEITV